MDATIYRSAHIDAVTKLARAMALLDSIVRYSRHISTSDDCVRDQFFLEDIEAAKAMTGEYYADLDASIAKALAA